MRKIIRRLLGSEKKIEIFCWITERIATNGQNVILVVEGPQEVSYKIKKGTINFEGKTWWTLARHRLCPTTGDDILSQIRAAMRL